MQRVYEAANNVEAHMLVHLLQQAGVEAHVQGEHLQSGGGELPLSGLVAVVVPDERVREAREIIRDWEARTSSSPDPVQTANAQRAFFGPLLAFIVGALAGGGVVWSMHHGPETAEGVDRNDDGALDERAYYSGERLDRVEIDRNFDGGVDAIQHYDLRGNLTRFEADDDFDGRFETWWEYRRAEPHLAETDLDGDGHMDYRTRFRFGVMESYEYLNAEGAVVKRITYRGSKQTRAELDLNADGDWERVYEFDRYDEPAAQ